MKNILTITLKNGKILKDAYANEDDAKEAFTQIHQAIAFGDRDWAIATKSGTCFFAAEEFAAAELSDPKVVMAT
ncbi:MAG: hypothetical protein JOY69_01425 [Candidatus Eremiobacteraeota bacterium]|nr:hypothetical protein [Candidatus Eremiobacteraeota bacterium]